MADELFDGAIGIDLGTTYSYVLQASPAPSWMLTTLFFSSCSCVGVWQNDRVEIIANDRKFAQIFMSVSKLIRYRRGKPYHPFLRRILR